MTHTMTRVRLQFLRRRCRVTLRFGRPVFEESKKASERDVYFTPNTIFSTLRWHGNEHGTTLWELIICRAGSPFETLIRLTDVDPGAEGLLRVSGESRVRQVLAVIDQIETQRINPADVNPAYWRTLQSRLIAREVIPEYSRTAHAAYLNRLRIFV